MKQYYILPLFILLTCSLLAQEPFKRKVWEKKLENIPTQSVDAIGELSTGNLVLLSNGEKEFSHVTIMRRNGDVIRTVKFNKYKNSKLNALTITKDNKILLVGTSTASKDKIKGLNGWAILIDASGKMIWENVYGGKKDDELKAISPMEGGGFLLMGNTKSFKNSKENAWAVRINDKGEQDWSYNYGGEDSEIVNVGVKAGNVFILGGRKKLRSKENGFLIGIDELGKELWTLELPDETNILAGISTFDDKAVFTGYQFNSNIERDALIFKIDIRTGEILWKESYGSEIGDDYGQAILEMLNGKLMLVGRSYSHRPGSSIAKMWHLKVNTGEGSTKDKIEFFGLKKENSAKSIFFTKNSDVVLGGMLNELPYIGRFKTELGEKPTITWNNIGSRRYKRVFKEEKATFLDISATISSPILLKKSDLKIYMNHSITNDKQYYDSLIISQPSISTFGDDHFLYTVTNRVPVTEEDTMVEMRLYNNLYSVRSDAFYFKLANPFRLDMLWIDPVEANTSRLAKTVRNNNVTLKMIVMSSEELVKGNFHIIINGRKTEGAKYGETVINPFMKKKKEKLLVKRYNYINNVFLQKGRNEIKLAIDIDGETHYSTPIIRNYEGEDGDFNEIKVDTTYDANVTNLHVLAIGAQHSDLKYTTNDAQDIANAFKGLGSKKLFKSVNVETLIGKNATKTNIDIALERYKTAYRIGEITRNDLLVVFISSHGFIYKDSIAGATDWISFEKFLIQASDFDNVAQEATSVAYENIISTLAAIRCKKIVLIDACFSGGVQLKRKTNNDSKFFSENESINDLISQLSYQQPGLVTITSSTASQPSYEDDDWKNGAFTEAIMLAFKNGDMNKDGIVSLSEMYGYISKSIPQLVKDKKRQSQKPTITNFDLGKIPIFQR
ncbi:MAG: caspase family protein [Saprospiraceae bacterium]